MGRYDLADFEWCVIEPLPPNKPRGVPRVDDRRVLNSILWMLAQARRGGTCGSATGQGSPYRCMGRSRGGLTTKIHVVTDATGLPIRYEFSPGQAHDSAAAGSLLADLPPDNSPLADKAYDAEWIRNLVEDRDAVPIIPTEEGRRKHAPSANCCNDCVIVSDAASTSSSSSAASLHDTKSSLPTSSL